MSCNGKKKKRLISKIVAEKRVKTFEVIKTSGRRPSASLPLKLDFGERGEFMTFWMQAMEGGGVPMVYNVFFGQEKRYTFYDDEVLKIIIDGETVIDNT